MIVGHSYTYNKDEVWKNAEGKLLFWCFLQFQVIKIGSNFQTVIQYQDGTYDILPKLDDADFTEVI